MRQGGSRRTTPDRTPTPLRPRSWRSWPSTTAASASRTRRSRRSCARPTRRAPGCGRQQNADGGWPYYSGGASDANSTGLSLSGILTQAPSTDIASYRKASRFLGTVSGACADGGGLAYQSGSKVDGSATAQGLIGLVGPMPVRGPRQLAAARPARTRPRRRPSATSPGRWPRPARCPPPSAPERTTPARPPRCWASSRAGQGRAAVAKATTALKASAASFVTGDGTSPGAAGLLLMVAEATGGEADLLRRTRPRAHAQRVDPQVARR